jgi:hypothetical protein
MQLTENLLREAAGWDVMKRARFLLEQGRVLSSFWAPPLLRGVVQDGESSFRASMVIKSQVDIENLCTCREAREWGKICEHGVAVGLHWLEEQKRGAAPAAAAPAAKPAAPVAKSSGLRRDAAGEPAALFVILPPNFEQAAARDKVMLVLEAEWSGGRCPLNALPRDRAFAFAAQDAAIIDKLEILTRGETPAILQIGVQDFAALLPALAGHPHVTQGKTVAVTVTTSPVKLPLWATLEAGGGNRACAGGEGGAGGDGGGLGLAETGVAAAGFAGGDDGDFARTGEADTRAGAGFSAPSLAAIGGGGGSAGEFQAGGFFSRTDDAAILAAA